MIVSDIESYAICPRPWVIGGPKEGDANVPSSIVILGCCRLTDLLSQGEALPRRHITACAEERTRKAVQRSSPCWRGNLLPLSVALLYRVICRSVSLNVATLKRIARQVFLTRLLPHPCARLYCGENMKRRIEDGRGDNPIPINLYPTWTGVMARRLRRSHPRRRSDGPPRSQRVQASGQS